jgi:hypothetical protein
MEVRALFGADQALFGRRAERIASLRTQRPEGARPYFVIYTIVNRGIAGENWYKFEYYFIFAPRF